MVFGGVDAVGVSELPGRVGVDQLEGSVREWWGVAELGISERAADFAGGEVSCDLTGFDPGEKVGVVLLDGGDVLDGAGGNAGPAGDVVSGLASGWQNLHLRVLVQVLQLAVSRAFFQLAVAVELERERRALGGA